MGHFETFVSRDRAFSFVVRPRRNADLNRLNHHLAYWGSKRDPFIRTLELYNLLVKSDTIFSVTYFRIGSVISIRKHIIVIIMNFTFKLKKKGFIIFFYNINI